MNDKDTKLISEAYTNIQENAYEDFMIKKFLDAVAIQKGPIELDRITVEATPKGNWRIFVDGQDFGLTIDGKLLNDQLIDKYELRHYGVDEDEEDYWTGPISQ